MFTIDRLAKLDDIADAVFKALRSGLYWLERKHEDFLVDTTYRVVEAKAAVIDKTEDKISGLEDARRELVASGVEAKALLREKYEAELAALNKELADKGDKLDCALAAAAESLVAANKDYGATVREANDKLGVEVKA